MPENQEITADNATAQAPGDAAKEYEKKYGDFVAKRDKLLPINKAALFCVLAAAGITAVIVSFDGYGDSGQIENIEPFNGNDPAQLPDAAIGYQKPAWGKTEIEQTSFAIHEVIETMAYELLSQTHCGWENNDGAYGEFTFDVSEQTITLDYNERHTSSENYTHEF
jgi:hypothetical protein